MRADWGCAGAQTGAAQGRRLGLRRGADWGCAGGGGGRLTTGFWRPPQAPGSSPGGYWGPGQRVREGLTTGSWPRVVGGGCAGPQTGAAQGRRLGLCRSADWGCAGAQTGAAQGRRLGLRRSADWGCAGAQTGAAHGRRLGLRRSADWGCAGAQTGAAQGRRLGLCRGADWGCAGGGGGGASPQAFGDPPRRRAPHQEVIGARASVCARASPQAFGPALSGGGRAGGPFRLVPPGVGSVVHGHRPAEAVSYGAHVGSWPRAHGGGSQLSPPEVLAGCPWGGGGMRFRVFWEASYLPWQNPGGLFALGNLR